MSTKNKNNQHTFKRTMYYFWRTLMQSKLSTIAVLILVPVYIYVGRILVPRGTSNIVGQLAAGDFEINNYIGLLLATVIPAAINNIGVIRIIEFLDWHMDAVGSQYLSNLSFHAIIKQSMNFHSNHFSGSLSSQANKLPDAYIDVKSNFIWDFFPLILYLIYSATTAFFICPPFAAVLLLFAALYATIATITYYKTRHVDEEFASAENRRSGQLADSITNVLSVKSYAREKYEKDRFRRETDKVKKATYKQARVSFWRNLSLNCVGTVTFVITLILVIMAHNLFGLSVADTVFMYSLASGLLSEIWVLNHILRVMNRKFGNAKEMIEILDLPFTVDDKTDAPLKVTDSKIEFDHIMFKHAEQKTALFEDFSLTIKPGERIGLVGISGSGKTTLTKLLLRFADVNKGGIYIDNQNICDVTQQSLREAIAYVPQESNLFHRSISENIAYGKPDATKAEILEAAKLAHADDFIENLPKGYDTEVGERGVKLSGGQRQRIAIARAILKNAPILVLDEATSALDSESEAAIQKALNNLMKGRTSIVIAHRLSTVANLDRIVVLEQGRIIEQGTHEELLTRKNGTYKQLWSRQSGAFLGDND